MKELMSSQPWWRSSSSSIRTCCRPGQHVRVGEAAAWHQCRVEGSALDVQQVGAAPVGDPLEAGVREPDPDLERHRGPRWRATGSRRGVRSVNQGRGEAVKNEHFMVDYY